jgi:hypothetical protein
MASAILEAVRQPILSLSQPTEPWVYGLNVGMESPRWSVYRLAFRPIQFSDAFFYQPRIYARSIGPLRKSHRFFANGDKSVVAPIVTLLFPCDPLAVVWRISLIVVYSVYLQPIWRVPHVSQEVLEILPRFAEGYSSPSIPFIGGMTRP